MSYLVMEVHPAYAVVLDQEGRFLKAANLHYQVGERVEQIVPLREPQGADVGGEVQRRAAVFQLIGGPVAAVVPG